jgi:transcriptional regulator with XRE-family HTH domain
MADDLPRSLPIAAVVASNVRAIRTRMRLSAKTLADRVPWHLGFTRDAIANLETGRRRDLSVDELAGLAEALGLADPWSLTAPEVPPCEICHGTPPTGFQCLVCFAESPPSTKESTE